MGRMARTRRCVGLIALGWLVTGGTALAQVDPIEIIDRVEQLYRGESSRGTTTMEIVTENWDREITMEVWYLGNDYSLVRIH